MEEGTQHGEVDLHVLISPITRAQTERIQKAIHGLVLRIFEEKTMPIAGLDGMDLLEGSKTIDTLQVQLEQDPITMR